MEHKEKITKQPEAPTIKKDRSKDLEYQRQRDREMVRGIFRFYEVPGGSISFNYRCYKLDPVERFDMVDGQIYTVPLGVAKHLNKNCAYPIHTYMTDSEGNPIAKVGQKVRRVGFQSLEFVDVEELTGVSQIVTVETTGL